MVSYEMSVKFGLPFTRTRYEQKRLRVCKKEGAAPNSITTTGKQPGIFFQKRLEVHRFQIQNIWLYRKEMALQNMWAMRESSSRV